MSYLVYDLLGRVGMVCRSIGELRQGLSLWEERKARAVVLLGTYSCLC